MVKPRCASVKSVCRAGRSEILSLRFFPAILAFDELLLVPFALKASQTVSLAEGAGFFAWPKVCDADRSSTLSPAGLETFPTTRDAEQIVFARLFELRCRPRFPPFARR